MQYLLLLLHAALEAPENTSTLTLDVSLPNSHIAVNVDDNTSVRQLFATRERLMYVCLFGCAVTTLKAVCTFVYVCSDTTFRALWHQPYVGQDVIAG